MFRAIATRAIESSVVGLCAPAGSAIALIPAAMAIETNSDT
jgi:hypothetical protein